MKNASVTIMGTVTGIRGDIRRILSGQLGKRGDERAVRRSREILTHVESIIGQKTDTRVTTNTLQIR